MARHYIKDLAVGSTVTLYKDKNGKFSMTPPAQGEYTQIGLGVHRDEHNCGYIEPSISDAQIEEACASILA
jgi:hypothetical protein